MIRKEEERNEKIIRGLLKLPPNRRCINCNSLGPQYVCTNFWTFVCTTCSGIHREFTHRVKSVSMAKFSTQEVEALQRGGNQRAREIFLHGWDMQNNRLPNISNIDKIREFIKAVYVEKKYARGTSSDKPPKDVQNNRHFEEDRKASSYHSYSQSPPYDHQYEDRRYGKQSGILTRRTGSDRLHYDGKLVGVAYSPGRMREHVYEDQFANDGSGPRYSDYSVSSAGETSRYVAHSPNFQDSRQGSLSPVGNNLFEEDNVMRDLGKDQCSWRTASTSSFGSGNPLSLRSVKSDSLADVKFSSEQHSGSLSVEATIPPSVGQFTDQTHAVKQGHCSLFSIDSLPPSTNSESQFIDLFADVNQPPSTTSDHKLVQISPPQNEGWATFDLPEHVGPGCEEKTASSNMPSMNETTKMNFDLFSSEISNSNSQSMQTSAGGQHISLANEWNMASHEASQSSEISTTEFWNPFDDCTGNSVQAFTEDFSLKTNLQVRADESHSKINLEARADESRSYSNPYSASNLPEESSKPDFLRIPVDGGLPVRPVFFDDIATGPTNSPVLPNTVENAHRPKSVNPFDFPCEPEPGPGNVMDMSDVHLTLPNQQFHATFPNNIHQSFFSQNPLPQYMSAASSDGLSYVAGQPPSTHLQNLSSQSHVASVGGNPFA